MKVEKKPDPFRVEYEMPMYRGIVFRRSAFTKKDWDTIVRRCNVTEFEAERIISITIESDERGRHLNLSVTVEREESVE